MKSNANPLVVENLTSCAGRSIDLVGQKLQDVVVRLRRKVIDVEVELPVKLRKYRGKKRQITRRFRMIGIRNDETGDYHFYVTNVGQQRLSAEDVGHVYALRWQVELLFRRLRSHGRLHQLPTQQEHIVKALIWASILAVLVSQKLLWAMRLRDRGRHLPESALKTSRFGRLMSCWRRPRSQFWTSADRCLLCCNSPQEGRRVA